MAATRHTDEEKAEAVATYVRVGLAEAHRLTAIAKSTLQDWARNAGYDLAELSGTHARQTENGRAARLAHCEAMRLELREQLLMTAGTLLDRIDQPHIEYRGQHATQVEYPVPPADACKHYVTAAAICIDKYRLEVGEATDRVEVSGEEVGSSRGLRDELSQRRERLVA